MSERARFILCIAGILVVFATVIVTHGAVREPRRFRYIIGAIMLGTLTSGLAWATMSHMGLDETLAGLIGGGVGGVLGHRFYTDSYDGERHRDNTD